MRLPGSTGPRAPPCAARRQPARRSSSSTRARPGQVLERPAHPRRRVHALEFGIGLVGLDSHATAPPRRRSRPATQSRQTAHPGAAPLRSGANASSSAARIAGSSTFSRYRTFSRCPRPSPPRLQVVAAGRLADQRHLREVWTGAAVGTAGDAQHQWLIAQAVALEQALDLLAGTRQVPLGFPPSRAGRSGARRRPAHHAARGVVASVRIEPVSAPRARR